MTQFLHIHNVSIPIHSILFIGWNESEDGIPAACIYLKDSRDFFYVPKDSEDFKSICTAVNRKLEELEQ